MGEDIKTEVSPIKKEIPITDEQMRNKFQMKENIEIAIDVLKTQIKQYEDMITMKLPERQTRAELNQKKAELERNEKNLKIIEKQIRERKEVIIN